MQLVLKESSQIDREGLMEYLDGKAFQKGNTRRCKKRSDLMA